MILTFFDHEHHEPLHGDRLLQMEFYFRDREKTLPFEQPRKIIKKAQAGQAADYPEGIPECGTDALRFGLCAYTAQGRDINLDVKRIEGYRKFCNKLWNAIRFAQMQLGDEFEPKPEMTKTGNEAAIDEWILSRLANCVALCNSGFKEYDFPGITTAIYNFWLYELCDVYLEAIKPIMYGEIGDESNKAASKETLYTCLDTALKLTAPFMPFVSEELWQRLPRRKTDSAASVHVSKYPKEINFKQNKQAEQDIDLMMSVIKGIRSIRGEYKLTNKQKTEVFIETKNDQVKKQLESTQDFVKSLSSSQKIIFQNQIPPGCVISVINDDINAHIMLKGVIDFDKELKKMEKNLIDLENKLKSIEKKMGNSEYKTKVPNQVQAQDAEKAESLKSEMNESRKAIEGIKLLI